MTASRRPNDVDLRGFASPFAIVRRQLEVTAQCALGELAARERVRDNRQAHLDEMQREYGRQLQSLYDPSLFADPRHRHGALVYLAQQLQRVAVEDKALEECAARVEDARQARITAQLRLDVLQRLHDGALDAFAAQQRHRMGKEADQAWLASRVRGGARRASGSAE